MCISIAILSLILSAPTCRKEDKECHESFFLENNSQNDVIIALRFLKGTAPDSCKLNGNTFSSGQSFELDLQRSCWEEELRGGKKQVVYVVDPSNYNDPSEFYPCDSIEERNTILKKYELSLEDLQMTDFRVIYP